MMSADLARASTEGEQLQLQAEQDAAAGRAPDPDLARELGPMLRREAEVIAAADLPQDLAQLQAEAQHFYGADAPAMVARVLDLVRRDHHLYARRQAGEHLRLLVLADRLEAVRR